MCDIHHDELHRVGFDDMTDDKSWPFYVGFECEVVIMSYVGEMIKHAKCGRTYTTCATPDELYDAWNASGRCGDHNIVVLPSVVGDALDFRLVSHAGSDDCDLLTPFLAFIGICVSIIVLLGWYLS